MSAKISDRRRANKKVAAPVNGIKRRPRGRPRASRHAESDAGVLHRAENYRGDLSSRWDDLRQGLIQAKHAANADEAVEMVTETWLATGFADRSHGFPSLSVLAQRILVTLRDKKWPTQRDEQITFLADALSGFHLAPRTAHELCERERKKVEVAEKRRAGNQIRQAVPVFDVECSCGYRGHSVNGACPACGALVPPWL